MNLGCAMYIYILKPASYLSLCLQKDSIDVIFCMEHILKPASSLESLSKKDPKEWPIVKLLLSRINEETDGETTYQGGSVLSATITTCSTQAIADLKNLTSTLRERLSCSYFVPCSCFLTQLAELLNFIAYQGSKLLTAWLMTRRTKRH